MDSLYHFQDHKSGNFLKTQNMNKAQVKKKLDKIYSDYKIYLLNNLYMPDIILMVHKKKKTYFLSSGLLKFSAGNEE